MRVHGSGLFGLTGFVLMLVLVGGCGKSDAQRDTAGPATPSETDSEAASQVVPPGPSDPCPLTAEEVGKVLGVVVQQDSSICMFEPEPGTEPNVTYVRQVSFACSEAVVNDPSFELEPYDGLVVQAYANPDSGDLMVCTNPPFEITVDITPSRDAILADAEAASAAARASERDAAVQLARLILDR